MVDEVSRLILAFFALLLYLLSKFSFLYSKKRSHSGLELLFCFRAFFKSLFRVQRILL